MSLSAPEAGEIFLLAGPGRPSIQRFSNTGFGEWIFLN
jgi:hypothetical protein